MNNIMMRVAQATYTFVLMNWAAVAGLHQYLKGHEGFWNVTQPARTNRLYRA